MSPSTLSEVSYTSGIRQTSADREGQESLIQERSYSVMIADIEGLKLDLLILQKKGRRKFKSPVSKYSKTRRTYGRR